MMIQKQIEPSGSRLLQPLKEIGLTEKTQCWDIDEIQAALREAYSRGIPVESLYNQCIPAKTLSQPTNLVLSAAR